MSVTGKPELRFENDKYCHRCDRRIPDKNLDCPFCFGLVEAANRVKKPLPKAETAAREKRHAEQNPKLPLEGEIRVK